MRELRAAEKQERQWQTGNKHNQRQTYQEICKEPTSLRNLSGKPATRGLSRKTPHNRSGTARMRMAEGTIVKKYCSKAKVKSKVSRHGAAVAGPKALSAAGLQESANASMPVVGLLVACRYPRRSPGVLTSGKREQSSLLTHCWRSGISERESQRSQRFFVGEQAVPNKSSPYNSP